LIFTSRSYTALVRSYHAALARTERHGEARDPNAEVDRHRFETLQHASWVIGWISFYSPQRRHSTLGYLSPIDYEKSANSA
jgi:hypothetical protein